MKHIVLIIVMLYGALNLFGQIPDSIQQQILQSAPAVLPDTVDLSHLGQPDRTAQADSSGVSNTGFIYNFFKKDYPNPKKAMLMAIFPGGGQLYNKRFWKLPLVYGAFAGMTGVLLYNRGNKRSFDAAYAIRLNADPPFPCDAGCEAINNSSLSNESIRERRLTASKNLQLSYIGIFAVVVLTAADAFVDAHLKTFDVDEELSYQPRPVVELTSGEPGTIGFGLALKW